MNLSILMLTHNRPALFNRAINSVFKAAVSSLEIIVNNDTQDIDEIYNDQHDIKYLYHRRDDLTEIYKLLFDLSSRDYVYFLEDDDYLSQNFFKYLNINYDMNFMNYISTPLMSEYGLISATRMTSQYPHKNEVVEYDKFMSKFKSRYFQLGQIVFHKKNLAEFPTSPNDIHNDMKMLRSFTNDTIINYIDTPLWIQTIDGGDNISFDHLSSNR